jgi:hypothetical protein
MPCPRSKMAPCAFVGFIALFKVRGDVGEKNLDPKVIYTIIIKRSK